MRGVGGVLTDKYRPRALDEVVGQDGNVEIIEEMVNRGVEEVPHMLFHGPPGTGKTSTAVAVAEELDADYAEYNASDSRRIEDVRDTIIPALYHSLTGRKVVFLDEFDQVTNDAQSALRRPLETTPDAVTVIASCNKVGQVLVPIRSRFMEFEFDALDREDVVAHVEEVAAAEGVEVDPAAVAEAAEGDLRTALTLVNKAKYDRPSYKEVAKKYGVQVG